MCRNSRLPFAARWILTNGCIRRPSKLIDKAAGRVSRTHVGTPQIYLLWIVIGAIVVTGIMLWVNG